MTTKSERHLIADRLAEVIRSSRMTNPFGGDVNQSRDHRSYDILFARPRTLDGLVRVFSPKFIQVMTQGAGAPGYNYAPVFSCEAHAKEFLECVARGDKERALAIPVKERKKISQIIR